MPTRAAILDTLAASQTEVLAFFQGLSPYDLERPATANGVPGAPAWRAKDHFAHLVHNERNIQQVLRRIVAGETGNVGNVGNGGALIPEEEQQLAMVIAQFNQTYLNAHHDDSLETLVADFLAARQDTLDLLHQFTDEQLAATVRTPGGDEIVGDLFAGRAGHAAEHITAIEDGWRQDV
jgi:Mycothiol maleylpyruvate isomerase N-terminal domain